MINQEKKRLRAAMEQRRASLSLAEHRQRSEAACRQALERWLKPMADMYGPLSVAAYIPVRSEIDIFPIIRWGWEHGHQVAVPKVDPDSRELRFHRIVGMDDLEAGAWGIREPSPGTARLDDPADAVLVPGLAFDRNGNRLGYGGGYYDRLLRSWRIDALHQARRESDKPPFAKFAALAFQFQSIDEVPAEPHDEAVELVITEQGIQYSQYC